MGGETGTQFYLPLRLNPLEMPTQLKPRGGEPPPQPSNVPGPRLRTRSDQVTCLFPATMAETLAAP